MVSEIAEQPSAKGTHQEGCSEQHRGVELLHDRITVREESRRKVERESGIGVKIIPLDQIADRADEDGLYPPLDIVNVEMVISARDCSLLSHSSPPRKFSFSQRKTCALRFPEQDGKLPWTPHRPLRPRRRAGRIEPEIGNASEPFLDCDRHFHAREVRADAAVDPEA